MGAKFVCTVGKQEGHDSGLDKCLLLVCIHFKFKPDWFDSFAMGECADLLPKAKPTGLVAVLCVRVSVTISRCRHLLGS